MGLLELSLVTGQFDNCLGVSLVETFGNKMRSQAANAEGKCKEIA